MPLKNTAPDSGDQYVNVQRLDKGGTGATTAPQALQNLKGFNSGQMGIPGGLVLLDGEGKLYPEYLEGISFSDSAVDGDTTILVGESKDFFLTTYDSFTEYVITAVGGSVSRNENVIRYTAGNTPGVGGFFVNNRQIFVNIVSQRVDRPSILTPLNGTTDLSGLIAVQLSEFETTGGFDSHLSTDWEIATDPGFSNIVASSHDDFENLTSWEISDLDELTTYYVRARHRGASLGLSDWSIPTSFSTSPNGSISEEVGLLIAHDYVAGDKFGQGVAISDDAQWLFVGAPYRDDGVTNAGAVYVYERDGFNWTFVQKIVPNTRRSGGRFGHSVATNADGTELLIGSIGAGRTTYFRKIEGVWTELQEISVGGWHGTSVALNADATLAVAGNYNSGNNNGSIRTYERTGDVWTQVDLFSGPGGYNIGWSLSLSSDGTKLLYGARNSNRCFYSERNGAGWLQHSQVTTPAGATRFGSDCSISDDGTVAFVSDSAQKKVYRLTRSGTTWTLAQTIEQSPVKTNDFGSAAQVTPNLGIMVIGAADEVFNSVTCGGVYTYR